MLFLLCLLAPTFHPAPQPVVRLRHIVRMSEDAAAAAATKKAAAAARTPFGDDELDSAVRSLQTLAPEFGQCAAVRELFAKSAHADHKMWANTEANAEELRGIIGGPSDSIFRKIFMRVLQDGNFAVAESAASARTPSSKPWIVLVTGLNGIRKTTSVQQPWFKEVLREALGEQFEGDASELPTGGNSFFRQLDYMIATLALTEFEKLYTLRDIATYAATKDAIFARYRTAAEMLGVLLIREAQQRRMNVMVETSGRDIGMYEYVDHLFPDDSYRKLVLNFEISDIRFAERSVDARMEREMADGEMALSAGDPMAVVRANAGGPYGSAALVGVQADSRRVWQTIVNGGPGDVGHAWYKASVAINAESSAPWTCQAVGSPRTYEFGPPRGAAASFAEDQRNPCVGEDGEACAF